VGSNPILVVFYFAIFGLRLKLKNVFLCYRKLKTKFIYKKGVIKPQTMLWNPDANRVSIEIKVLRPRFQKGDNNGQPSSLKAMKIDTLITA